MSKGTVVEGSTGSEGRQRITFRVPVDGGVWSPLWLPKCIVGLSLCTTDTSELT